MKRICRTALALVVLSALSAEAQEVRDSLQLNPRRRPVGAASANKYLVVFKPGTGKTNRAVAAQAAGALVRHNYDIVEAVSVTVPSPAAVNALRNNPNVLSVRPDYTMYTAVKPGTGGGGGAGGGGSTPGGGTRQVVSAEVQRVGPPTAASNGAGVGVAILDTGIDGTHPDLSPALAARSYNAFNGGASCQDDVGHGTHVAGLLGAQDNNQDIVGVAPKATIYCVKVLGPNPDLNQESVVIAGLDWIYANLNSFNPAIRVINMSLGRPFDPANDQRNAGPFFDAIDQLYRRGVTVVVSAGNDYTADVADMVPAGFTNVFAVASTVATTGLQVCTGYPLAGAPRVFADTAAEYTTDGAGITISAPGDERHDSINSSNGYTCLVLLYGTLSTTLGGGASRKLGPDGWAEARGTSFAAPLVAGSLARIIQLGLVTGTNQGFVENLRNYVKNTAVDRKGQAPYKHPWFVVTDDLVYEGIVQAPR